MTRFAAALAGAAVLAAGLAAPGAARADVHIGVIVSLTGPGASLGMPADNTIKLWPAELGGQKIRVTTLNDATDTTTAAKNATRLITEDKVDVIVGPSVTPTSLAVLDVAARAGVPVISLAGGGAIVEPPDGPRRWAFKMAPTEAISINAVLGHMRQHQATTVATIGLATAYGEGFLKAFEKLAPAQGVKLVASEKYAPTDTSVTPQIVKLMAARPDAVYIFSSGTPGALPHVELVQRGYKGLIYQTQGVANADFLRVGGKALDGSYMTVAPVLVADQLPDGNPVKMPGIDYVKRYEAVHGAGSRSLFGATAWDAQLWLNAAIPTALKRGQPGTPEFRLALRDGLEGLREFVGAQGVFNLSEQDHNGVDQRSQVLVTIERGAWKLVK
ncbi:MAG TPA: ABC transporter substrate-binding protein [Burkholderiaceae bacterium]|nr:ABC transporter substrate-binding protein [Burkholderiaceae bacterium]